MESRTGIGYFAAMWENTCVLLELRIKSRTGIKYLLTWDSSCDQSWIRTVHWDGTVILTMM